MSKRDLRSYADVLSRVDGVSAWIVRRTSGVQHQRYLLPAEPEAERTVDETQVSVTIVHDHDGGQGRASITLHGDDPLPPSEVEDAVFRASLQGNPPYALPEPATPSEVQTSDPALASDARKVLDAVQERVFARAAKETSVRLAASEIFVSRNDRELLTSTGAHLSDSGTSIMMEATLVATAGDGTEEESFGSDTVRRLSDLDADGLVARHAERARHKLATQLPTSGTPNIVMSHGTFVPLLGPFTFATGGGAIYRDISPLSPGDRVFGEREVTGDRFSLTSDPTLPYAAQSRGFDDEGLCLAPVAVIEDGVFRSIVADKRHADYLDIEPTGGWHNQVLAPGTRATSELLDTSDGPVLHIVDFSWLNPDGVRGSFSTEIRLAYELHPSGETRVISGGSVSGNCYDAFAAAHLSKDTELDGGYFGPESVRFSGLLVAGA